MKKYTLLTILGITILFNGCVSQKEYANFKSSQDNRVISIQNSLESINSKLSNLTYEFNSLNSTLMKLEGQMDHNDKILEAEIIELKNRIKSTNDVIATLRIEVALLTKKLQ